MLELIKVTVIRNVWFIPVQMATPGFLSAVDKLNFAKDRDMVQLTDEEAQAFWRVRLHESTWIGL